MDIEALLAASESDDDSVALAGYNIEDLLYQDSDDSASVASGGLTPAAGRAWSRGRVDWDRDDRSSAAGRRERRVLLTPQARPMLAAPLSEDDEDDADDENPRIWGAIDEIESEEALLERILAEDDDSLGSVVSEDSSGHGSPTFDVDRILAGMEAVDQGNLKQRSEGAGVRPKNNGSAPEPPADLATTQGAPAAFSGPGAFTGQPGDDFVHPLVAAEMYEKLLLRASHAAPVSPLKLKRRSLLRKRPRTTSAAERSAAPTAAAMPAPADSAASPPSTAASSPAAVPTSTSAEVDPTKVLNLSGPIRVQPLATISSHLAKNAAYASHGPGLPTVLGVHPRLVALGTSRALVLLFDESQQVKQILGRSADADTDGAVAAIDISSGADFLVSAFVSGKIVLWELARGTIARVVEDAHASAVSLVRFAHPTDPVVVGVDTTGVVNRITFTRSLFTTWTHESECLLDGAAGPIPMLAVLPHLRASKYRSSAAAASAGASGASRGSSPARGDPTAGGDDGLRRAPNPFVAFGLIALSSERSSFVVSCYPELRVIHKWARPSREAASAASGSAANGSSVGAGATSSGDRHGVLPCLAWSWAWETAGGLGGGASVDLASGGDSGLGGMGVPADTYAKAFPLLARAWDRCIQFLAAVLPESETPPVPPPATTATATALQLNMHMNAVSSNLGSALGLGERDAAPVEYPAFGVRGELATSAPVLALEWLRTGMLLYLDADQYVCVYDVYGGAELQHLYLASLPVYVRFNGVNPSAQPRSFGSSFRGCEVGVLLLGTAELRIAKVQTIRQRIDALVDAGEWLSALALSLDHFDDVVMPRIRRELRQRRTRLGLPAAANEVDPGEEEAFWSAHDAELMELNLHGQRRLSAAEEDAAQLLLVYLSLGVNNAPREERSGGPAAYSLADSHYQMLAGVCMEYCCLLRRPDLLFGDVYETFRRAGRTDTFLGLLEPFITSGQLTTIGAEAMEEFLTLSSARGDLRSVERSLLRIRIQALDFNRLLPLLRTHRLFSALAHLYTRGLGDFLGPVEAMTECLLAQIYQETDIWAAAGSTPKWQLKAEVDLEWLRASLGGRHGALQAAAGDAVWHHWRGVAYKLLLYLRYSLAAQAFPQATPLPSGERYPPGAVVRAQLLWFLLHPKPALRRPRDAPPRDAELRYPLLQALLMIDAEATLEVLAEGFLRNLTMHVADAAPDRRGSARAAPLSPALDPANEVWNQLRSFGDRVLQHLPSTGPGFAAPGITAPSPRSVLASPTAGGSAAVPGAAGATGWRTLEVPRFFADATDDATTEDRCGRFRRHRKWDDTNLSWGAELPAPAQMLRVVYKSVFHPDGGYEGDTITFKPLYTPAAKSAVLRFAARLLWEGLVDMVPRIPSADLTLTLSYRICVQLLTSGDEALLVGILSALPGLVVSLLTPRLLRDCAAKQRPAAAIFLHHRALKAASLDAPVPPCTATLEVPRGRGAQFPSLAALSLEHGEEAAGSGSAPSVPVPAQHLIAAIVAYLQLGRAVPAFSPSDAVPATVFDFLVAQLQRLKALYLGAPDPHAAPAADPLEPGSAFSGAVASLRDADAAMEFTTVTGEAFDPRMIDPALGDDLIAAGPDLLGGWWKRSGSAAALVIRLVDLMLDVIGPLVHVDARRAAALVAELAELLPALSTATNGVLDQALGALEADPTAQFRLLQVIVNGALNEGDGADPVAASMLSLALTPRDKALYLNLLAHYEPDAVYDHVVQHDDYALDEALRLCNRLKITDATVYLLERSGDARGALDMMLTSLGRRLEKLRDRVRGARGDDPLGLHRKRQGHRDREPPASPAGAVDLAHLMATAPEGAAIERAIRVLLDICRRSTASFTEAGPLGAIPGKKSRPHGPIPSDSVVLRPHLAVPFAPGAAGTRDQPLKEEESGGGLWFCALDELLRLRRRYHEPRGDEAAGGPTAAVVLALLRRVLQAMMGNAPLAHIVARVTGGATGALLGDFRDVLGSLLDAHGDEAELARHAAAIVRRSAATQKLRHLAQRQGAVAVRVVDHTVLPFRQSSGDPRVPQNLFRGRGVLLVDAATATATTAVLGRRGAQADGPPKESAGGFGAAATKRLKRRRKTLRGRLYGTSLSAYEAKVAQNWRPVGAHPTSSLGLRPRPAGGHPAPPLPFKSHTLPDRGVFQREMNPSEASELSS